MAINSYQKESIMLKIRAGEILMRIGVFKTHLFGNFGKLPDF